MSVPMHKHCALWIYKIVMANNQLRPPPNVRRELNHLTNVITPVMGQHSVNARMHSMRTLSRFFHPIANSSVESVTSKGHSMPQWGVCRTRIEEGSDRQSNQMLNLIFPKLLLRCTFSTDSIGFTLKKLSKSSQKRKRMILPSQLLLADVAWTAWASVEPRQMLIDNWKSEKTRRF